MSPLPTTRRRTLPLSLAGIAGALAAVWLRPGPGLFLGVDAGCYARVARELAARPLSEWAAITLGGGPFLEHPPLGLWLEALAFWIAGPTAETATTLARCYATAVVAAVFLIARHLADDRAAALSALALVSLSGFLHESQNAMLELPLTLALLAAAGGAIILPTRRRSGVALFAGATAAAALIKGPPALLAFLLLAWVAWRHPAGRRRCAVAATAAVVASAVGFGLYELWRASLGLEPFASHYFIERVLRLGASGPADRPTDLVFYVRPLTRWYAAALIALPLSIWAHRRLRGQRPERLLELAWIWGGALVVAFSLARQRSYWFIHPLIPAAGWWIGRTLAWAIPPRVDRAVAGAVGIAIVAWIALTLAIPDRVRVHRREQEMIRTLAPPLLPPDEPRQIAHCGTLGTWRAIHLFAFYWQASLVPCDAVAPLRFDGHALTPAPRRPLPATPALP